MYTTLFGEDRLSALEYAKLLIDIAYSRPIHTLQREPDIKHEISFRMYNVDNNEKVPCSPHGCFFLPIICSALATEENLNFFFWIFG
jgi:hypothetical protein